MMALNRAYLIGRLVGMERADGGARRLTIASEEPLFVLATGTEAAMLGECARIGQSIAVEATVHADGLRLVRVLWLGSRVPYTTTESP